MRSLRPVVALAALLLVAPAPAQPADDGQAPAAAPAADEALPPAAGAEAADEAAAGAPTEDGASAEAEEAPEADPELRSTALLFFQSLISGVPEAAAELSAYPFNLDGEVLTSRRELIRRLDAALATRDLSRLAFYGLKALPADRMIAEHGAPPSRLGDLELEGAWVAVANLGGQGYVAVFRQERGRWVAFAYTD